MSMTFYLSILIHTEVWKLVEFRYDLEFQLKNEKGFNCRLLDCSPETSLMDILHIMSEYHIRRLPVIAVRHCLDSATFRIVQCITCRMTKHWAS